MLTKLGFQSYEEVFGELVDDKVRYNFTILRETDWPDAVQVVIKFSKSCEEAEIEVDLEGCYGNVEIICRNDWFGIIWLFCISEPAYCEKMEEGEESEEESVVPCKDGSTTELVYDSVRHLSIAAICEVILFKRLK